MGKPKADVIAPDGDVILVVGSERARFRVHSTFLKAVSKPFSAMFSSRWNEGNDPLHQSEPIEIPLPDDDSMAMLIICAVIHHQYKSIPRHLPARTALQVAITADKYDCVDSLQFASGLLAKPHETEARNLMVLTAAAYGLQNADIFKEITKTLILTHTGSYLSLSSEDIESVMDWKVFYLLEEARSITRLKLASILLNGVNDITGSCCHRCGWTSTHAYAYVKQLEEREIWPAHLSHKPIYKVIETAETMPDPVPKEESAHCTYSYKHCLPEYRSERQKPLENLTRPVGLCLHCIISNSGNPLDCKLTHND
ncbi:hypothetical protein B0J11DRAFT_483915 [Dendryphion nanum]|uniref:BTB domain-containing protein n=1 Tax=Dendryphion nanum TaxID=256645 RepID=A0A9P9E1B7_9PLEO|nr:hypothetical protein B0J11DRAFT_483915 [Dendryphion nanum]